MVSFSDFNPERIFEEFDAVTKMFVKRLRNEIEEIEKAVRNGELEGKWNVKEINEPGVKGFVMYGQFTSKNPLNPIKPLRPLDPLRPIRRPLISKTLLESTRTVAEDIREPLIDIFEEEDALKLYAELPGEEKDDIQLNITGDKVEIKAKRFYKMTELPTKKIDLEKASAKYKNGVLQITIPKVEKPNEEGSRRIRIE